MRGGRGSFDGCGNVVSLSASSVVWRRVSWFRIGRRGGRAPDLRRGRPLSIVRPRSDRRGGRPRPLRLRHLRRGVGEDIDATHVTPILVNVVPRRRRGLVPSMPRGSEIRADIALAVLVSPLHEMGHRIVGMATGVANALDAGKVSVERLGATQFRHVPVNLLRWWRRPLSRTAVVVVRFDERGGGRQLQSRKAFLVRPPQKIVVVAAFQGGEDHAAIAAPEVKEDIVR